MNSPVQITFEADPVLYAALSPDGRWLAYLSGGDADSGLRLRAVDPARGALPRRLTGDRVGLSAPAISPDSRWVAFAAKNYDVKGDIYLMRMDESDTPPRRLTGRETEDGAPSFSPDGRTLYFHQARPGQQDRYLVSIALGRGDPKPRPLDVGGDGAFPSISPDGKKCAFISYRDDPAGDIFLVDLQTGRVTPLTRGKDRDLFPVWSRDGEYIYFTRFALDTNRDGKVTLKDRPLIYRVRTRVADPVAYPVTSASYGAYQPMVSRSRLYFLSTRKGVSNLWALPLEGEIPFRENAEAQMALGRELSLQVPPDYHLAALGYYRVLEGFWEQKAFSGRAAYNLGKLYQRMEMSKAAARAFRLVTKSFGETTPEAGLSRTHLIVIGVRRRLDRERAETERRRVLKEGYSQLESIRGGHKGNFRIQSRGLIEQARLLAEFGKGSESQLKAIRLLDRVVETGGEERSNLAEAMVLRADLLSLIGGAGKMIAAYEKVIKTFPDVEEWADRAVARILELSVKEIDAKKLEDKTLALARVAEKYHKTLPRLAMGAWNRVGDLYFSEDEWARAKEAYRQVLGQFPLVPTQTAAARMALAEILYREERFRQTLDLYEKEMASRPTGDYLYELARAAYVKKSIAAGEFLFRLGEVPAARNTFVTLIREDYSLVEAHRGYIKSAAAQNQIPTVLGHYRRELEKNPADPTTLYATGLSLTYLEGKKALEEARSLIRQAIEHQGQVEYFHQTMGYIEETLETAYGVPDRLEPALESYRRAHFLNDPRTNPENAANLDLNLGNVYFLLGQHGKAFERYSDRFESGLPFDEEETEILFYRRFGTSAFRIRDRDQPIVAFSKALDLIEKRIRPKQASEIMGRVNRYIVDRIITPASGRAESREEADKLAKRQADLNRRLHEASRKRVGPPPDPTWKDYREVLQSLVLEQEEIIGDLGPLLKENRTESIQSVGLMVSRARDALQFPQHLVELKAEMLDRLGLAFQEAEKWSQARESFERTYELNERLGLFSNLAGNQRSIAFNAYSEAGALAGEKKEKLLLLASGGFRKVIRLVDTHGVAKKEEKRREKGIINIALDVSLDEVGSSQAMHGFTREQEKRLAETFISRIEIELGNWTAARSALTAQLADYPPDSPLSDKHLYGVSLLNHRAGHLAYATGNQTEAFDHFKRSAQLALRMENPVSAALNLKNMAHVLAHRSPGTKATREQGRDLVALDRKTTQLLHRSSRTLERLVIPTFHNAMGVYALTTPHSGRGEALAQGVGRIKALERAGQHFFTALKWLEKQGRENDRKVLSLLGALHLNLADLAAAWGEPVAAREHLERALETAERGLLPEYAWRAQAGLGRMEEALESLDSVTLLKARSGPGEITGRFAPMVADRIDKGEVEEAFNLLERLSEIERVHRLTPMVLGSLGQEERQLLGRVYPRLKMIQDLRGRITAAKGTDGTFLSKRLKQEQELLDRDLGKKREKLPSLGEMRGPERAREWLMILVGLAVRSEAAAEAAVSRGAGEEAAPSRRRFADLMEQYDRAREEVRAALEGAGPPGPIGALLSDPAEAIDVMESLPEGGEFVRLFSPPGARDQWIAFRVTPDEISAGPFKPDSDLDTTRDHLRVFAYEDPSRLPDRIGGTVALSGTHLVRSIRNRKPFKRKVLAVPFVYPVPQPFQGISLSPKDSERSLLERLPETHTLLINGTVQWGSTVPTRQQELPTSFVAIDLGQGRPFPLTKLSDGLSNVSLAILSEASLADAYPLVHLLSLFGVPTVLLPRHTKDKRAFLGAFMEAYGESSVEEAIRSARSSMPKGEGEDWFQFGHWGMKDEEARRFARKNFTRYVRTGLRAFKEKRAGEALILFENALSIAAETKALRRYLPDLHKSARESAFAAGRVDRAVDHARSLVDILVEREPDSEAHGSALLRLGLLQARSERYDQAIPMLEEAAEIMGNLELGPKEVAALADLGVVLENATEYDRALVQFQSALSLSESLNKRSLLARQYMSIGRIYDLRLNQYARARKAYGQAHDIYRELGQRSNRALALLNMGRSYRLMGNFLQAEEHYGKALSLVEPAGEQSRFKAKIIMEQANNAWYQARYQEAFNLQRKVLTLARTEGWSLEQVMALNTSGLTWWTLGDHERALRDLGEALTLARTLRARRDEVATALNNMGLVYRDMGRFDEALDRLGQALAIDREIKSRWAIAYDLRNLGLTHVKMGEPAKAVPLFREALNLATSIGNRINEAKILVASGEALGALDRVGEAQEAFENALKLSRVMALRETEWRALYGLAKLGLKEGRREEARDLLVAATGVIEAMRADIKLDQLKDGFVNNKMSVYETLVSLLVDLGETSRAFDTAERSRARNLIDLLGHQRLDLKGAIERELYDRQKTIKARIHEQEALLAQAGGQAERSVYGSALKQLHDEYRDLMLEIQAKNPELATLVSVSPMSLAEIQGRLEPGVALLAFYVVPGEVLSWLVKPGSIELFRTPIRRERLGESILNYRRMIQNLEPLEIQSRELFSLLMAPAVPKLGQLRALAIVPHGTLHYLSFGTLYDGKDFMVDRFSLFYLPSASMIRYTMERRKEGKNLAVLAIGNPSLGNQALELPFAEREVSTIGWNFPNTTLLTREKATESWIVQHIGEFGIIHIASHGNFDPINPLFSALKLARDISEDGDLEASEIFSLRINADLVFLSACQTGLGKVTGGDDVIGMNRAFLYAGTHAIISSLWRVSDISTAMLVKQFYREYATKNKAESLRRAILHVKNRYAHPGYWGAFVLVGDYY